MNDGRASVRKIRIGKGEQPVYLLAKQIVRTPGSQLGGLLGGSGRR